MAGTLKPVVSKITIVKLDDCDPDLSYLKQDYSDCTPEEQAKNKEHDRQRLETYGETWVMCGVRATAEVLVPSGSGCSSIQFIKSCGLWGIESDSSDDYFLEVANDELHQLKEILGLLDIARGNEVEVDYFGESTGRLTI